MTANLSSTVHADEAHQWQLAKFRDVADGYLSNEDAGAFDCAYGFADGCGECGGCVHLACWNSNVNVAAADLDRAREAATVRALLAVLA